MNEDGSAVHFNAVPTRNGSEADVGPEDFFSYHLPRDYDGVSLFVLHGFSAGGFLQFQSCERGAG